MTLALTVSLLAATASAQPTLSVDKIRPGMKGYGLTVFRGFKIERFKVEVIDVIRNFMPKQDVILMRIDHPVLRKARVVGGMSGSPIFLDNKLVGALAYGWRFSREAITGVTNIKSMFDVMKLPSRGPPKTSAPRRVARVGASPRPVDRLTIASLSRRDRWWRPTLPRGRRRVAPRKLLEPVSVPLGISGFSPRAVADLRQAFSAYGFEPVQGGGSGGKPYGPKKFVQGGAIGVQMVAGDKVMVGTGTVTAIRGNKVLAFGHSAFNAGEIYLPVVSAKIIHTLASVARSFKLSRPARVLGALEQDRQAAILANTKLRVGMVPMTVRLRGKGPKGRRIDETFKVRLAKHRLLTGTLVRSIVSSAMSQGLADIDRSAFRIRTRIKLKGRAKPFLVDEQLYSTVGPRRGGLYSSRGLRAARALFANPFKPVEAERIDVEVDVSFREPFVAIDAVRLNSLSVAPGSRISVFVTLRTYGGKSFTRAFPLEVPASLAGSVVRLVVASGSRTYPTRATPRNFEQYLSFLQTTYSGKSLIISMHRPTRGLAVDGRIVRDLPDSVFDQLNIGSLRAGHSAFRSISRDVFATKQYVTGRKQLRLRIKAEE